MKSISFTKMHGCGNDYIYINLFGQVVNDKSRLTKQFSDRHFGIGGDGVIFISPSSFGDFKMEIYNADGSLAEMCGNGIRCATVFARNKEIISKDTKEVLVESAGMQKQVYLTIENDIVTNITVNMGKPEFSSEKIPILFSKPFVIQEPLVLFAPNDLLQNESLPIRTYLYDMTCVSIGNPHCVIFVEDVSKIDLTILGPLIENHELFPNRTNVEFVQVLTSTLLKMRVWERGSGETLACGTGCCAALVASVKNGFTTTQATVQVLGGELFVEWDSDTNDIFLTGPATTVFEGIISLA